MKPVPSSIKGFLTTGNRLWFSLIAVTALITRIPHLLSAINPSYEFLLTYFPTLAAARFQECAYAILYGSQAGSAFSFASPLYILLLVPLYAIGLSNTAIFILQSVAGIFSSYVIFFLTLKTGCKKLSAYLASAVWLFYAPVALYETSLLPVALISLLIATWALIEFWKPKRILLLLILGLVVGTITGLRPPFIILGVYSILNRLLRKQYLNTLLVVLGFAIPILAISFYHHAEDDTFSPFASSLGVNLVQGHSAGASGYGPPIPEYGLIESPSENIHEVGTRVAAENGYTTESEANSFWLDKALTWILNNPKGEFRLLGVKLGAFLGYIPFDSYFDLKRDVESDSSLRHLLLPRSFLILVICFGISSWLLFSRQHWYMILPIFTALITTLGFFACERYWIPAIPVSLVLATYGIRCFCKNFKTSRLRTILAILLTLFALLPGLIWPVPEIPEGMYLFNRAVKAFNLGNSVLALSLFEESAENSTSGSTVEVHARIQVVNIALSLGMTEKARKHYELLQEQGIEF